MSAMPPPCKYAGKLNSSSATETRLKPSALLRQAQLSPSTLPTPHATLAARRKPRGGAAARRGMAWVVGLTAL
eukprot:6182621-Pleurochrysis_carterae.AAC.2